MNITIDMIREKALAGGNYPLALAIAEGVATNAEKQRAARYIKRGVKAAAYLQAAIDMIAVPETVKPVETVRTVPEWCAPGPRGGDPLKRLRNELVMARHGKWTFAAYKATENLTIEQLGVLLGHIKVDA
jgi:hypothetical protein